MSNKETSRSPELAELLRNAIRDALGDLHVSLPGKVETYSVSDQTADIQPLVQRRLVAADGTELDPETLPILRNVPVAFPRGGQGTGAFFITWPLEPGDLVHVVFNERSIDQYLAGKGEVTDPLDFRMHNLSDGVAYLGMYPRPLSLDDAHPQNMVLGLDGGIQIHLKPSGEIDLGSENAAEFVALAQKTFDEIDAVRSTLNSLITAYNAHIHITTATVGASPTPGVISPTTSQGTPPAAVKSVAADKVKAD